MTEEELFMQRCIDLAQNGAGNVAPNPLVGAVIVHQNKIIGEGWHKKFGEAHAEVNAINSVQDKSILSESTIYINLEPCSHHGKTPPCADLIIHHRFKKVVIGMQDPFDKVAGNGIKKLKDAGIEVIENVLKSREKVISSMLIGNNIVNILASALATAAGIALFGETGLIYATIAMTLIVIVLSEIAPKTFALKMPDKVAMALAPMIDILVKILFPFTHLIQKLVEFRICLTYYP